MPQMSGIRARSSRVGSVNIFSVLHIFYWECLMVSGVRELIVTGRLENERPVISIRTWNYLRYLN